MDEQLLMRLAVIKGLQNMRVARRCRRCGARVVWARHIETHRFALIDPPGPDPEGIVLLVGAPVEFADLGAADTYLISMDPGDEGNRTTFHNTICPEVDRASK